MSLGKQIQKYREALGLKLDQLAELSEVQPGTISALAVRGSSRSQHAVAIARKGFGLTLEQLLDVDTDHIATAFQHVRATPPKGWIPSVEVMSRVAAAAPVAVQENGTVSANAPIPLKRPTRQVTWPFKLVTYDRIERIKKHFSGPGMPAAISEIDKHLDILVARWEHEMNHNKSSAR